MSELMFMNFRSQLGRRKGFIKTWERRYEAYNYVSIVLRGMRVRKFQITEVALLYSNDCLED